MIRWTDEAKQAALRAQPEYGDDIVLAIIQRAEDIAGRSGYPVVDTDMWFQRLLDVRLPGLEGQWEILA